MDVINIDNIKLIKAFTKDEKIIISIANNSNVSLYFEELFDIIDTEQFKNELGVSRIYDFEANEYEIIKSKWSNIYISIRDG